MKNIIMNLAFWIRNGIHNFG